MTDVFLLLKGLLIGLSIAAPVGPIGLLCIKRSLEHGLAAGLATGLGAATADAFYGAVAGFGLASISSFLTAQQTPLRIVGGLVLLWLGASSFRERPARERTLENGRNLFVDYATTVGLTLTNPATIISFAAVFASVGLSEAAGSYAKAGSFVAAVFVGSALWWLALSTSVSLVRARISTGAIRWINRASGLVLIGFAVSAWASLAA
jgi:threonine/homoserine/homoserine lactone efflux protein